MKTVREGKALILVPELPEKVSSSMTVFYNPKMRVNRDLAVLGLRYLRGELGEPLKVADPLAASGIRAIRFLKEVDGVEKVYVNDIKEEATALVGRNFRMNDIPEGRYEVYTEEANSFLRKGWGFGFDYIDLDPFGSPVPFVESAALSMKRGGVLSLTATDTAPLSGTYPKTCLRRYGARPIRNEFKHEVGIRILIKKVIELSAQYDIAMVPLFAYSHLHYFKLFFRKDRGAKLTNSLMERMGYILYCFRCLNRGTVRDVLKVRERCSVCGAKVSVGGPLWLGRLWDETFTDSLYEEAQRSDVVSKETVRILKLIKEESRIHAVGFYTLSKLSEKLGIPQQPPVGEGVRVFEGSRTHFEGDGFRTPLSHNEVIKRATMLKR
ncbi:MAG TPA: tRNA (guanine(10)-N(2))-dimethyltransferase, partial [Aquifex aeolicus]|nr:tRNA (guanine(10)-N(2))-dimethyltransferase [Aquifex aeolicus]